MACPRVMCVGQLRYSCVCFAFVGTVGFVYRSLWAVCVALLAVSGRGDGVALVLDL